MGVVAPDSGILKGPPITYVSFSIAISGLLLYHAFAAQEFNLVRADVYLFAGRLLLALVPMHLDQGDLDCLVQRSRRRGVDR
ncbi:hypothetical protein V9P86_32385, partial [Pseudomonas aeruginosa]